MFIYLFIDHTEGGRHVNQHRVKCKGGETPEEQAVLVSNAFTKPMEISEWVEEKDGVIHLQCSRLNFVEIRFRMGDKVFDSWMQTSATTKQKEKLASVLFEQRVVLKSMGMDDEGVKVHFMTPFAQRYRKPVDNRIATRQLTFPGAPPPERRSRMPIETRKRWGGLEYRQTRLVDDVVSGEKITAVYDPTQRLTEMDPDIEAEVTGAGRDVPGDTFKRTITWVWPRGTTTIINGLNIPVKATPQDLLYRICRALKVPELDHRFMIITPEDWRHAEIIRVEFAYERPGPSVLREVTEKRFRDDYESSLPVFIETDGACAGNAASNRQEDGGQSLFRALVC
jgi:hypothetical protein